MLRFEYEVIIFLGAQKVGEAGASNLSTGAMIDYVPEIGFPLAEIVVDINTRDLVLLRLPFECHDRVRHW